MLTDSELAGIRSTSSSALPGTAIIQSQGWESDGGGGGSIAWTAAGTFDCRISPIGGSGASEEERGDRIAADADFIITLPFDASVDTNSRLLIDEEVYNVEAIRSRSWNASTRVEATKET